MKKLKSCRFAVLAVLLLLTLPQAAQAQYYNKRKSDTPAEKKRIFIPQHPQGQGGAPPAPAQKIVCTEKEKKTLSDLDKGFAALNDEKQPGNANAMMDFLNDPGNIQKTIQLIAKCRYNTLI